MSGIEWSAVLIVLAALEVTVLVPLVVVLHYRLSHELNQERRELRQLRHLEGHP